MKRYLKVDFVDRFSSICDTKEEVMEGCGYFIGNYMGGFLRGN